MQNISRCHTYVTKGRRSCIFCNNVLFCADIFFAKRSSHSLFCLLATGGFDSKSTYHDECYLTVTSNIFCCWLHHTNKKNMVGNSRSYSFSEKNDFGTP